MFIHSNQCASNSKIFAVAKIFEKSIALGSSDAKRRKRDSLHSGDYLVVISPLKGGMKKLEIDLLKLGALSIFLRARDRGKIAVAPVLARVNFFALRAKKFKFKNARHSVILS